LKNESTPVATLSTLRRKPEVLDCDESSVFRDRQDRVGSLDVGKRVFIYRSKWIVFSQVMLMEEVGNQVIQSANNVTRTKLSELRNYRGALFQRAAHMEDVDVVEDRRWRGQSAIFGSSRLVSTTRV
jgi:hypothetical protein